MKTTITVITLQILVLIGASCSQGQQSEHKHDTNQETTERLKFTSGIRTILQDSKGNYWFGSHQEGVARYDGKTFTYFASAEGLTSTQIYSIREDATGKIWLETSGGVYSYQNGRILKEVVRGANAIFSSTYSGAPITNNDLVFFAESHQGIYRYDGKGLWYHEYPFNNNKNSTEYGATGSTRNVDGTIWIATYSALIGYDGVSFEKIDNKILGLTTKTGFLHVRSIYADSKNRVWIGNNGIGVMLKEGSSIINFSEKMALVAGLSKRGGGKSPSGTLEHVFAITEDKQGNIWFGDRDTGAWMYDGKKMKNFMVDSTLDSQHIWTIYPNKAGEILIGMASGGVYKYEKNCFVRIF